MPENFIYDGTELYTARTDSKTPSGSTTQVTAAILNQIRTALGDIRTVLGSQHANVLSFGATGDGVTDDTAAIQAAITATQGIPLYFPSGRYLVSESLLISSRCHRLVGDYGNRFTNGATEIAYTGAGPCIQIGVDNGHAWDALDYDGPQDQVFENLWIRHASPDTGLVSSGDGGVALRYKAGAYGIWDWRAGQVVIRSCGIEGFEANFVGINSDVNSFQFLVSLYSKYGIYLGPRSDQNTIDGLYSFTCDRAITIDRAQGTRLPNTTIVDCGTSTVSAIEIRQGSSNVLLDKPWFEHLNGYTGTDQISFVSVGEVSGYGTGGGGSVSAPGSSPTTTPVVGCDIRRPLTDSPAIGEPSHVKYIATVGKCNAFELWTPIQAQGNSLGNFDQFVAIPAAQSPTAVDTQIYIKADAAISKLYTNLGAGTPALRFDIGGTAGAAWYTDNNGGRFSFKVVGAAAGAEEIRLSQEGATGQIFLACPTYAGGQTTRLRLAKAFQQSGSTAAAPSSGTWEAGDCVPVTDPSDAGHYAWICTVGGTPGTWRKTGPVLNSAATLVNNATSGNIAIDGVSTGSAQAGDAGPSVRGICTGTFDATAVGRSTVGMKAQSNATRSAGAQPLTNIGLQASATGGQVNRAILVDNGDVELNTTSGITRFNNGLIGTGARAAAPSTGAHVVGEIVFNVDPIATGFVGWVCVTAGTPGTWKSWGVISA